tara:strand:- start:1752 stop:1931 length:180 start_codon:yes stop_codon:yes gene_type:complete
MIKQGYCGIHPAETPQEARMSKFKLMILVIFGLTLAACSTIEGMGQDVSDTARWTRNQL